MSLDKRLDIEGVEYPETKDFMIRRDGQTWVIDIGYEESAPVRLERGPAGLVQEDRQGR